MPPVGLVDTACRGWAWLYPSPRGLKHPRQCVTMNDSLHPPTQEECIGTCYVPDATLGTRDSWVNVTDRSCPQAGPPRPHREHDSKGPKPHLPRQAVCRRMSSCPDIASSVGWKLSQVSQQNRKVGGLLWGTLPCPPTFVGHLYWRPGTGHPERSREHRGPQAAPSE